MWETGNEDPLSCHLAEGVSFLKKNQKVIAWVWMNSTLSFPRSRPPHLTHPLSLFFFFGREQQENTVPKFSSFALSNSRGQNPPRSWFTFKPAPSLHPWLKPFAHKAMWKLMFLLISLFESTIMKSGCTVVNSTFYIYSSYLSYI